MESQPRHEHHVCLVLLFSNRKKGSLLKERGRQRKKKRETIGKAAPAENVFHYSGSGSSAVSNERIKRRAAKARKPTGLDRQSRTAAHANALRPSHGPWPYHTRRLISESWTDLSI